MPALTEPVGVRGLGEREGGGDDDAHVAAAGLGGEAGTSGCSELGAGVLPRLESGGLSRRVVAVVPSYAVGALMALQDDVIFLLPQLMTSYLIEQGVPLRQHSVPFDLPLVHVEQRWHRRLDQDGASRWLRGLLDRVAREARPTGAPEPVG